MPILETNNLTKKFDKFTAVNSISFELDEGEILGFLGPNGAGKTTTIQMLLGILTPTSGKVKFFGKEFNSHKEEILEDVNFSSTYINFPWELTVGETLSYISYLYDINDRKKRIQEVSEIFDIKKLLDKKIMQLSEGQKTKVNLAKSFLNSPKVLLLDEPTASLDPDIAVNIRKILLEQKKDNNISIIFTSHNMAEVEEVCDRIIFIKDGNIVANDTPKNLSKTIKLSHVTFVPLDKNKFKDFCVGRKYSFTENNQYLTIDIDEQEISKLLQEIAKENLLYDEISIEKPSLDDYFMEIANGK